MYELVDIKNLEEIQKETLNFFKSTPWERLDGVCLELLEIADNLPSLLSLLNQLKLDLKYCSTISRNIGRTILKGRIQPSQPMQLLIPIKNFKETTLQYWESSRKQSLYGYHAKYDKWNLYSYNQATLIDKIKITKPMFYRTDIPHTFFISEYSKVPVIMLDIIYEEQKC